jgi:hypothetical protein
MSPMNQQLADLLYTSAPSNATISLPKKDWKSKTRNLLPDDKHFSSRDLLRLFLKPKARMGSRKSAQQQIRGGVEQFQHGDVDEAYWANAQGLAEPQPIDEEGARGDYDANFFQDDGLGVAAGAADDDDDFADAQEMLPPADAFDAAQSGVPNSQPPSSQETAFGSNLITQSRRMRPEYVQYARVAKKLDIRRLKEEMWRGIGFEVSSLLADPLPQISNNSTGRTFPHSLKSPTINRRYFRTRHFQVHRRDEQPSARVPSTGTIRHQHEFWLHLSFASCQRKGLGDRKSSWFGRIDMQER